MLSVKEEIILEKKDEWKETGRILKEQREALGLKAGFVAKQLRISPGRLKRFEEGEPVYDAKLLDSAYNTFLKFWGLSESIYEALEKVQ